MRLAPQTYRKLAPLFALAVSVSLVVSGELRGQTGFSVQAGGSLTTLGGADAGDPDSRIGPLLRASAILPLTTGLELQFGAGYAEKGATASELDVDIEFGLGYLEVPFLLRLSPSAGGNISPHFTVGPALSLRVSCNAAVSAEGLDLSVDCDDQFDDLKSIDLGAMAGAGLDAVISESLSISVDLFYSLGLSSISESDDVKNRSLSFVAGVAFPIG